MSFFDQVIEEGSYYIDKTLLVKDLLDRLSAVTLCTRPRRFGKTLNQTMLKCFFEDTAPIGGKDTRTLFNGLKIESAGEKYMEHQGKYNDVIKYGVAFCQKSCEVGIVE
ncbi:MAG: AAA family ATPase [Fibromonadaceae bacterium]|nr:AAA family ATPase [Fibromonadaceae bacterium]